MDTCRLGFVTIGVTLIVYVIFAALVVSRKSLVTV